MKTKMIVDIHCHILPGVDDGAPTMDCALKMLEKEYEQGVRFLILTPHYRKNMFEADERTIRERFYQLCKCAASMVPDMKLYLGCELHTNTEIVEMLRGRKQFSIAETQYVLIEFSSSDSKSYIREQLYRLLGAGYKPILAHAERYDCIMGNLEFVEELVDSGAYVQINADSILGLDGRKLKKFCLKLMQNDYVDFVGSDAHDLKKRPSRLAACAEYIQKKMGEEYCEEIMFHNPMKIINKAEGRK